MHALCSCPSQPAGRGVGENDSPPPDDGSPNLTLRGPETRSALIVEGSRLRHEDRCGPLAPSGPGGLASGLDPG